MGTARRVGPDCVTAIGVQVADEPGLAGVEHQLLADPPDDLDQRQLRVQTVGIGAPADRVEILVGHHGQAVAPRLEPVAGERDAVGRGHRPDEVAVAQRVAADEPVRAGERRPRRGGRASRQASSAVPGSRPAATTRRPGVGLSVDEPHGPGLTCRLPQELVIGQAIQPVEQDVGEVVPLGEERGEARGCGRSWADRRALCQAAVRGGGRAPGPRPARSPGPRRTRRPRRCRRGP